MRFNPTYSINEMRHLPLDTKSRGAHIMSLAEFGKVGLANQAEQGVAVVVVAFGTVKVGFDGSKRVLRQGNMLVINDISRVVSFRFSKACVGCVVTFSAEFLSSVDVAVKGISMGQFLLCQGSPIMLSEQDMEQIFGVAVSLYNVGLDAEGECRQRAVDSLFSALFYLLLSVVSRVAESEKEGGHKRLRSEEQFTRFMALLGEECERERGVEYYASRLNITPKYLSVICKAQTSKSASKVIDEEVVRRAKHLLMQSGMEVQDVAKRLNFISPSFFGKYFKQRVGVAPSRYRTQKM